MINEASNENDKAFNEWADKLEKMSDLDASREVFNRIMEVGDLDKLSKELLSEAYNYSIKLINQGKNLEPNLLKIYLQDIKGYNTSQVDLGLLILLLSFCGIQFDKK